MKTVLTIFGATGNLMHKKLVPALIQLIKKGGSASSLEIIAVSRREYDTQAYFDHLQEYVKKGTDLSILKPYTRYIQMDIHDPSDYEKLKANIYHNQESPIQNLFYLAVSPEFFVDIAKGIAHSGLIKKGDSMNRIVFEKPFGNSFESAKQINQELSMYLDDHQIFRIDHYLGKDMIQNILVMRFANRLLENTWSSESIKSVELIVKEPDGIGNRGEYYDQTGALKDMIQSHLLQMLALLTMEEPNTLSADAIRQKKIDVLKKTTVSKSDVIFGQYDTYLLEPKIAAGSQTETFVFLKANVHTPRWNNVPFFLLTGKKLDESQAEIIVNFKTHSSFKRLWPDVAPTSNQIVIGISGYEGIRFQMNVKAPGLNDTVSDVTMDYCHSCQKIGNNPEAYEKLLLDFIDNNATLFTSWEEIEASWNIIDHLKTKDSRILKYHDLSDLKQMMKVIEESSDKNDV